MGLRMSNEYAMSYYFTVSITSNIEAVIISRIKSIDDLVQSDARLITWTLWLKCRSQGITVTSKWTRWRLKSTASRLFAQPFIQEQIKENVKAPRHWPLWGNSPVTGEFSAQKASSTENVSIWWRHRGHYMICVTKILIPWDIMWHRMKSMAIIDFIIYVTSISLRNHRWKGKCVTKTHLYSISIIKWHSSIGFWCGLSDRLFCVKWIPVWLLMTVFNFNYKYTKHTI